MFLLFVASFAICNCVLLCYLLLSNLFAIGLCYLLLGFAILLLGFEFCVLNIIYRCMRNIELCYCSLLTDITFQKNCMVFTVVLDWLRVTETDGPFYSQSC